MFKPVIALLLLGPLALPLSAGEKPARVPLHDLEQEKVLYCVAYAHLDTQWRWDFQTTINEYLKATLDDNFDRIARYPGYVFNFTGSVRYQMMEEYYPQRFEQLRRHVADGRWFVSGSSVDEGDVNVVGSEAILRQVLYGNRYFQRTFGKVSQDFMLPDCFGFPASLPSIWSHCGLLGFSTQKLTWGSAVGIPFKVGVWEGPDGASVVAALDPGPYVGGIKGRVDTNEEWVDRVMANGRQYGMWADYHYYGVGDMGGAPREEDVVNYLASVGNPDGAITVALTSSDQMYQDITDAQRKRLPRYKGDLLLTEHSAGTLTSQSYMKRWNRKNEILADAAERAAVAATWQGGLRYPQDKIERAWVRVLANQMHDILPGTSIPRAYTFSWNDEIVASNLLAAVLTDAVGAVTTSLDTERPGVPLVVYNPLALARTEAVRATVQFDAAPPEQLVVHGPDGQPLPTQVLARDRENNTVDLLFSCGLPPVSWSVCDVRAGTAAAESPLAVTPRTLENERYLVTINEAGDIAGIRDKRHGREILREPARLVFTYERPVAWPAWNMDWADRQEPPLGFVDGPAEIRIVEDGPVRVALEVVRSARGSHFTQRISLARGGEQVRVDNQVDWQSAECALRASFPLTVSNPDATYNWGLGTIQRGNVEPTRYEVPSHEWFDLTDPTGSYGVTILEDCKFGSDKPGDDELRLTLLYTPGVRGGYLDQHSQDWGRHDFTYALYGHGGDWRQADSPWHGRRLNQPVRVFQVQPAPGPAAQFSLLELNTDQVDVRAVKKAEDDDRIIVRLQELHGKPAERVEVRLAAPITAAEEVDGQEHRAGPATIENGRLVLSMTPYSPRSFAVTLAAPERATPQTESAALPLPLDLDVCSMDGNRGDGDFASGRSLPAELLPAVLVDQQVRFELGSTASGSDNAVVCRGQEITLPEGDWERVHVLAAAQQDVTATFTVGDRSHGVEVPSWTGFVGQWEDRIWDRKFAAVDFTCEGKVVAIKPGYIKRAPIAWFSTHIHDERKGNLPYQFGYLFRFSFDVPPGATKLTLPHDPRVRVFAATATRAAHDRLRPAAPLYDDFDERGPIEFRYQYPQPRVAVFKHLSPQGVVQMERAESFDALQLEGPSDQDLVDASRGADRHFEYFDFRRNYPPHARSGAVGRTLPRLNDGDVARNHDDTQRCVWFDNEGRFHIDLGGPVTVDRIQTYSWHRSDRAPQYFSVWGASGSEMPDPNFRRGEQGAWELLGVVDSRPLGEGGVHASRIAGRGERELGRYRWLLWIAEPARQGTFFTEIDVYSRTSE